LWLIDDYLLVAEEIVVDYADYDYAFRVLQQL
jgi:hypothetical protein